MAQQHLGKRYDIIINGGGIVGFTLLDLILRSSSLNKFRVLLIERAKHPNSLTRNKSPDNLDTGQDDAPIRPKFSNRVSSITLNSMQTFEKLGVWSRVESHAMKVKKIKVWNYNFLDKIILKQEQFNCSRSYDERDFMFSVIENNRLSSALLESISSHPKSRESIIWNHELKELSRSSADALINLKVGSTDNPGTEELVNLSAPLVLGCDGFASKVRDLTKMKYKEMDLNKTAVVGTVKMAPRYDGESIDNNVAYQRFSAEKQTVAALLPLDDQHCSFVISAPPNYAQHLMGLEDSSFIDEFNSLLTASESPANPALRVAHEVSNTVYDNIQNVIQMLPAAIRPEKYQYKMRSDEPPTLESVLENSRATYPLHFGTTSPRMTTSLDGKYLQVGLLGDAAHRVHPLAGQGLNLGIQDATVLVKHLEKLSRSGERIFNEKDPKMLCKALKRFELERQAYIIPMSAGILGMQCLFTLVPSRTLTSVNKCEFMKKASVTIANGCS